MRKTRMITALAFAGAVVAALAIGGTATATSTRTSASTVPGHAAAGMKGVFTVK